MDNEWGVGMPESLYLDEFARQLYYVFQATPYMVGSSVHKKKWRDVDIRILLTKKEWDKFGFGKVEEEHQNGKWCAYCMAFSELGRKITGLPIDFQIQELDDANKKYQGQRNALIFKLSSDCINK